MVSELECVTFSSMERAARVAVLPRNAARMRWTI